MPPALPSPAHDEFREKILRFIGPVSGLEILNTIVYRVHHRVASSGARDRVFLMGDAAHLITPMWALGLNTGILDAISLPWRLAWVARGWASDALLDGYAREQQPVAAKGSGEMAERRANTWRGEAGSVKAMSGSGLGQRRRPARCWACSFGVDEAGDWSMVKTERGPLPRRRSHPRRAAARRRRPAGAAARSRSTTVSSRCISRMCGGARTSRPIAPGLRHFVVSRRDAPLDGGLRDRSLFDVGDRFRSASAVRADTLMLVRPDDHVAAIAPIGGASAQDLYRRVVAPAKAGASR